MIIRKVKVKTGWSRGSAIYSVSLMYLDSGFETRWGHGCSSLVFMVPCACSGLSDELVTRSEESYRVCACVSNRVWPRNINNKATWAPVGLWCHRKITKNVKYMNANGKVRGGGMDVKCLHVTEKDQQRKRQAKATLLDCDWNVMAHAQKPDFVFRAKRTSPFKSAGGGVSSVDYWQPEVCASAVVMLDTPCSEVVWRVLATHYIRQFPLHFPSRSSPCATTFQLDSVPGCSDSNVLSQSKLARSGETCDFC